DSHPEDGPQCGERAPRAPDRGDARGSAASASAGDSPAGRPPRAGMMGPLINFLVLLVLLFAGLAQAHVLPARLGYGIAGGLAGIGFTLAIVRYRQGK